MEEFRRHILRKLIRRGAEAQSDICCNGVPKHAWIGITYETNKLCAESVVIRQEDQLCLNKDKLEEIKQLLDK